MAIPNKPAGPYTLDAANPLTSGATVYMMDQAVDIQAAQRATALGMTQEQGYYAVHGNVTLKVDDPHGIGLADVGGSPDNYIVISDNGATELVDPDTYNIPFTKLFVFRPDTNNVTLFHSDGKDSADFNYSNGGQLIRVSGGNVQFLKANQAFLGGTDGAPVIAGEVNVVAVSYDGSNLRFATNGVDYGTVANAQSGWAISKVWLGQGGNGDSQDGMTYFMMAHWNDAKPNSSLVSLTANPYQLVGAASSGGGGDPGPTDTTAPTVSSYLSSTNGSSITFTASENVDGYSAFTPVMFSLSGNHSVTAMSFAGTDFTLYVEPPLAPGENNVALTYTAPDPATGYGIFDAAGNHMASFTINALVNNAVAQPTNPTGKPTLPGYILMTLGDKAGAQPWADFGNEAEMTAWVNSTDCRNLSAPVMIWNYLDRVLDFSGVQTGPIGSDGSKYITFKPAPGRAFWELEPDNADGSWGTVGDTIQTTNTTSWTTGMKFEGWRVFIPANAQGEPWRLRRNGWNQAGSESGMKFCRFRNESTLQTFNTGEYGNYTMIEDCTFDETNPANTSRTSQTGGGGECYRSTFRRANVNNTTTALEGFAEVHACVFENYGATPYVGGGNFSSNYSNKPTTNTGCTYVAQSMFESGFRPAAGTAIINGGGPKAVSKNDINGNNRGLNPDAGAIQRTPAMPLAKGTLTKYEVDGSSLLTALTFENTVDSATISISAADSTSGAVSKGPFPMVLDQTAKTATYDIDDIDPGNYLCTILLTNGGGTQAVSGTSAFSILGIGGGTIDPGTTQPATSVALANAIAAATVGVESASMRLQLNGAYTGVVTVGLSDGAGGTFNPSSPQIVNGDAVSFTYTPASAGTKTITFTNDAGLANPASIQVDVGAAQLPAPTVSISTAVQNILMGSRATLAGALDFKGDAAGKIEMFFDPSPSGASVKFSDVISINGGTWTAQWPNLPVGDFRLRVVVTANGQTVSAQTALLRIVGLTGNVNVPIA